MFKFRITIGRGEHRRTFEWPQNSFVDNNAESIESQPVELPHHSGTKDLQLVTLPQTQCPLFNLPTELRVYIYVLVFKVDEIPVDVKNLSRQHLSILQTCRRILYEAETIFYELHRFRYSSLLLRIGTVRRDTITALTIVASSGAKAYSAMEKLPSFPNLKSLYIQRTMSIRFLDVLEWNVMARQMQDELAKLQSLQEFHISTPAASSELSAAEKVRAEKLDRVDAMLRRGASGEGSSIGVMQTTQRAVEESTDANDIEQDWDVIAAEDN